MVIFHTTDGQPGYQEAEELHDAVQFVESLRNRRGVEHARIFKMEEVPFDFKPYFRVELGEEPPPALDPDGVIRVEDLTWSQSHDAAAEPEPAGAPVAPVPVAPAPPPPPDSPQTTPPYADLPFAENGEEETALTESAQIPEPPPPPPPPATPERAHDDGDSVLGSRRGLFGR